MCEGNGIPWRTQVAISGRIRDIKGLERKKARSSAQAAQIQARIDKLRQLNAELRGPAEDRRKSEVRQEFVS